ncbi:15595_t:CDS:10 [Dentiscutata erythropus]|uniref:15595_t:CDS:1 n=1 Tax=Dentiscutata erythropus TaxID=1348616 RepID=A0A9N8YQ25_9GLOM|nr:15595_t:CDS:10 [Dentiscutata erythropus]
MSDIIEPSPFAKKILFMAIGSMGDVLPFINLGVGFSRRGHNVIIAANLRFKKLIETRGFEFREISWDMQDEWENTDAGRRMVKHSGSIILGPSAMFTFLNQGIQKAYKDAERVLVNVDFVILGTGSTYMYPECLARKIPAAFICFYPYASSKNYAGAVYGQPFNSLQWLPFGLSEKIWQTIDNIATYCSSIGLLPIYNKRLKELGLERANKFPSLPGGAFEINKVPVLYTLNKNLIQIPPNPNNPLEVQIDYPYLNIKDELENFVEWLYKGNKPIYFGYGSMHSFSDVESRVRIWLDIMDKLSIKHRALFSGVGSVKIPELRKAVLSGRIFLVGHVPHSWLFPRVNCVVHHGGAGTTHNVARAGVPSVVVPHFADQPWWASILHYHGLAPNNGIPSQSVTSDKLYEALSKVLTDEQIHDNARSLGKKIQSEHAKSAPISNIVSYIEQYWNRNKWDIISLDDISIASIESKGYIESEESNDTDDTIDIEEYVRPSNDIVKQKFIESEFVKPDIIAVA